jgi:hypothetical protein
MRFSHRSLCSKSEIFGESLSRRTSDTHPLHRNQTVPAEQNRCRRTSVSRQNVYQTKDTDEALEVTIRPRTLDHKLRLSGLNDSDRIA